MSQQTTRAAEASAFFDGGRLTLARQLAGLRKSELAQRITPSATAVAAWENGSKRPTPANVAQLALALSVEPGFFAVRPDDGSSLVVTPHFRSLRSTTQVERDQALAYGRLAAEVLTSLERHVEFPAVDVTRHEVDPNDMGDDRPEEAARALRRAWAMTAGPVGHLVRLVENHGVLVVFSPLSSAKVDAYSFDGHRRPVVVLNPVKHDYYRQRFDLAHELGHIVMHADAEPGGRVVETQAHRFASELLMPTEEIRDMLPTALNRNAWVQLARLKEQWGVSMQALLYRARQLGRLGNVSYRNAMATLSSRGWRRSEPGLVTAVEQPSLLPRAIELLTQEGIGTDALLGQCRVSEAVLRTVTCRTIYHGGNGQNATVSQLSQRGPINPPQGLRPLPELNGDRQGRDS